MSAPPRGREGGRGTERDLERGRGSGGTGVCSPLWLAMANRRQHKHMPSWLTHFLPRSTSTAPEGHTGAGHHSRPAACVCLQAHTHTRMFSGHRSSVIELVSPSHFTPNPRQEDVRGGSVQLNCVAFTSERMRWITLGSIGNRGAEASQAAPDNTWSHVTVGGFLALHLFTGTRKALIYECGGAVSAALTLFIFLTCWRLNT